MLRSGILSQRITGICTALKQHNMLAARSFSHSALAKDSQPFIVPKMQFEKPLVKPEEKRPNVMKVIEREALARADVDGRAKLFIRRAPPKERLCAGDVVFVETINSTSDPSATTTFSGVCIAIYRRGIDTSFILRNIVNKVGVEMRFMAYSPLVKRIEIMQKTTRVRRAKLFYLRENPGRTFQLKALKKMSKSASSTAKSN
ncbi:translation protein SH3-like domain-containing protein [Coemansia mojavensis]|nr:translation protein SH3-like domain-containing protein [Coemansia mojavensis]